MKFSKSVFFAKKKSMFSMHPKFNKWNNLLCK